MKNFNIDMIRSLSFDDVVKMAIEKIIIKEHDGFFVDFGSRFGYSVLVFKNKNHVYYADDFELHHNYIVDKKGKEGLKQYYINSLLKKLYTDNELMEDITNYAEYEAKEYFLRNYYIMRYDYISAFGIGEPTEEEKEQKKIFTVYSPVSFCYVKDEFIVNEQKKYFNHLQKQYQKLTNNLNTFRKMVAKSLYDHEAGLTENYTDALNDLNLKFENLTSEQRKIIKQELNKQINNFI